MKKYYVRFHLSDSKLQRSVGVLPWRHINQVMTKLKDDDNAIQYYTERAIEKGWNCDLLVNAIKLEMHKHQPENNVSNNFAIALPEVQAAYANEVFKDSYCMGFLGVTEPLLELELALEGFTKPIGVAEYKRIVPQKELKQLITDEIKTFNQEVADKSAELS